MNVEVKVYKRETSYYSETKKKDVPVTNFFIGLNDQLIPIEIKYFPNSKLDDRDPAFSSRVAQLSLIAEPLPERPRKEATAPAGAPAPSDADAPPPSSK